MIRQHSCRAGLNLFACLLLAQTGQTYSAAEKQKARQIVLSVVNYINEMAGQLKQKQITCTSCIVDISSVVHMFEVCRG